MNIIEILNLHLKKTESSIPERTKHCLHTLGHLCCTAFSSELKHVLLDEGRRLTRQEANEMYNVQEALKLTGFRGFFTGLVMQMTIIVKKKLFQ